jgi:hypothetical protein
MVNGCKKYVDLYEELDRNKEPKGKERLVERRQSAAPGTGFQQAQDKSG